MRGFKSKVTVRAREIDLSFKWKPRFNDQILFNEDHLENCRNYIKNNPQNWKY
jgi:hypothetical protein